MGVLRFYIGPTLRYIMITMMKYLIRFTPRFGRWVVRRFVDTEVMACGIRIPHETEPVILFSQLEQNDHYFTVRESGERRHRPMSDVRDYVPGLEQYGIAIGAQTGDEYQVLARRARDGRRIYSPKVLMRDQTVIDDDMLLIEQNGDLVRFDWGAVKGRVRAMIYFVACIDEAGKGLYGVYTRETSLSYPEMREVALEHGDAFGTTLEKGKRYTVRMLCVDYQGWVPLVAERTFTYGA